MYSDNVRQGVKKKKSDRMHVKSDKSCKLLNKPTKLLRPNCAKMTNDLKRFPILN